MRCLAAGLALLFGGATGAKAKAQGLPIQGPGGVTFELLAAAPYVFDRTVVQVRRFREENGAMTAVREELKVDATGTPVQHYRLTYAGLEGVLPGTPTDNAWNAKYRRYAPLLHEHGSFRIHDLELARANYTLHDFGIGIRANRPVRRVVVFPRRLDKAVWLLEVDIATSLVLYSAEYEPTAYALLGELEVTSFQHGFTPFTPMQPAMLVTRFADFHAATATLEVDSSLVEPRLNSLVPDYSLAYTQVTESPVNGSKTLVLTYTDGIDVFFVVQRPDTKDLFGSLPSQVADAVVTNPATIARYRDPAMSVFLFWSHGTTFQVVGRGSLARLEHVAKRVCIQGVTGT